MDIYNWGITKNWLDFGDLDLIFKVTAVENWKFTVGAGRGVGGGGGGDITTSFDE